VALLLTGHEQTMVNRQQHVYRLVEELCKQSCPKEVNLSEYSGRTFSPADGGPDVAGQGDNYPSGDW
jgi:hypothetical protein